MAPGWAAEPPRFPQEGGRQRGAQPSGAGRRRPASCLLQTFLSQQPFREVQLQRRGAVSGPPDAPHPVLPREATAEGTIRVLVAPQATNRPSVAWVSFAAHPHNKPGLPACAQTHELSFIHSLFQQVPSDARTTCEVLCKVLGKQQESRPLS